MRFRFSCKLLSNSFVSVPQANECQANPGLALAGSPSSSKSIKTESAQSGALLEVNVKMTFEEFAVALSFCRALTEKLTNFSVFFRCQVRL
jgi:hypothetical protein